MSRACHTRRSQREKLEEAVFGIVKIGLMAAWSKCDLNPFIHFPFNRDFDHSWATEAQLQKGMTSDLSST
jgi:hypothetical protein